MSEQFYLHPLNMLLLVLILVFTGLSAGLFFAWTFTVIPGTRKLPDESYLHTMQSINRYIQNPVFFLVFFGPGLLLPLGMLLNWGHWEPMASVAMGIAAAVYLIGVIGVTVVSNVPLNNQLDRIKLEECSLPALQKARTDYEIPWNRSNSIRTFSSILAFVSVIFAFFLQFVFIMNCFK